MTGHMSAVVEGYVASRRALGYRSPSQDRALRSFGRYLDSHQLQGSVPLEMSLDWAAATSSTDPRNPARRLSVVRGFLRHLAAEDGATQVPAPGLLGPMGQRRVPHVYSEAEITDLLQAATRLAPADGLRPHCYATLFGLIAATGLRICEALSLTCADVDLEGDAVLTVRAGKRGRTRLVPLHPSAVPPLRDYALHRDHRYGAPDDTEGFFRTDRSDHISYSAAHHTFTVLRRELGWTATGRTGLPRIHDLRHTMVVRRIQEWHAHGADVDAKIAVLATYLGHVEVANTYWYLSAVPELMSTVADRFEAFTTATPASLS